MCSTKKTCYGPRQYILEAGVPRVVNHGLKSSCVRPVIRLNDTNEVFYPDWSVEDDNTISITSQCNANVTVEVMTSFPTTDNSCSGSCGCSTPCSSC